jgi:AcrR family transcriptional regulator
MAGYHHGDLREAILAGSASVIEREGIEALSLRAVAADIGVSHTAFRRHFGSREGVLNALAVQGSRILAEHLRINSGSIIDIGVAYVRFALAHPGHFTVMFRDDLLDNDDPELASARAQSLAPLHDSVRALGLPDPAAAQVASWGVVHGVATLALNGTLMAALGGPLQNSADPAELETLTRRALHLLHPELQPHSEK